MIKLPYLTKEIQKIKRKESSFIGMDGGNIKSDLWFCGVEFGATLIDMEKYYAKFVKYYKINDLEIPYRINCSDKFLKSNFDRYLTSMYLNIFRNSESPEKEEIDDILRTELYNKNSNIFKLNLFPFAKTDIGWQKDFDNDFSITKEEYYGLLFKNRTFFLKKLLKRFSPKTIICFSPKDYSDYFVDAFFESKESITYLKDFITLKNGKKANIKIFSNVSISVIIIPFLGRGNLASYNDVREMTNYLKTNYL